MHEDNLKAPAAKRTNLQLIIRAYGTFEAPLSYEPWLSGSLFSIWRYMRGPNQGPVFDETGNKIRLSTCADYKPDPMDTEAIKQQKLLAYRDCPAALPAAPPERNWAEAATEAGIGGTFVETWSDWSWNGDLSFTLWPYNRQYSSSVFNPVKDCGGPKYPKYACPVMIGLYGKVDSKTAVRTAMINQAALLAFFRIWDLKFADSSYLRNPRVLHFYDEQDIWNTSTPHSCLMPDGSELVPEPDMPCMGVLMRGIFDPRALGDK
jgi:hypothetical protein